MENKEEFILHDLDAVRPPSCSTLSKMIKALLILATFTLYGLCFELSFPGKVFSAHFSRSILASTSSGSPGLAESALKAQLYNDMKTAMVNKEKHRLAAIRAIQSAIKQKEVDDRVTIT